ncbi:MAG TPA: nucleotide exchange factor GrpE [Symbiobacteriaceae bacterium]|nr:nucleotide exchange factor GrpE [Symbiobacteriaceae bacterium]
MSRDTSPLPDRLAITEKPIPTPGWRPEDGTDRPAVIARETAQLMRRLAEAEFALNEADEQRRKDYAKNLLSLLDVMDAFERVFRSIQAKEDQVTPQMRKWIGNFRTVSRMLRDLLTEQGVVRLENLADGFDPHWHRAVESRVDPAQPEGAILEEVRPGYVWRGAVLRKAEVVVVRHVADEETAE